METWELGLSAPQLQLLAVVTPFSDTYAIPIIDTLAKMRNCLGAVSVHLLCYETFNGIENENKLGLEHSRKVSLTENTD